MTDEYLDDPMAIGVVEYMARKGMVDPTQWLRPAKHGFVEAASAIANVQRRAEEKRREQAEAEIERVLAERGVAAQLAYHLAQGPPDIDPALNDDELEQQLLRALNGE